MSTSIPLYDDSLVSATEFPVKKSFATTKGYYYISSGYVADKYFAFIEGCDEFSTRKHKNGWVFGGQVHKSRYCSERGLVKFSAKHPKFGVVYFTKQVLHGTSQEAIDQFLKFCKFDFFDYAEYEGYDVVSFYGLEDL